MSAGGGEARAKSASGARGDDAGEARGEAAREAGNGLRREVGPGGALLVTVGAMLGSGVFATPHDVAQVVASPALTLALWAAGGALALLGALSFAELASALPETGGLYVYLRRAFGPFPAYLFAWAMAAVLVPSSVAFFAQVTARHLVALAGAGAGLVTPCAVGIAVALVAVNLAGVRAGAGVQSAATVLKYAGVLSLALLALWPTHAPSAAPALAHAAGGGASPTLLATVAALVPVLWAYDGWIDVTSIAGEVRDPSRQVPRALALGTALVTGLYLLANVAYLRALGPAALAASETPAADAAARALGPSGRAGVSLLVAVSTFGGCAVSLLTGSRVVYAVARDGLFVRAFAHTSRRGVPDVAVAASGLLAVLYLVSPLERLAEVFVVGAWPFYALGALATIALRRKEPALARPHRTPGYPYTLLAFAFAALAIVAGYAVEQPRECLASLGVIAVGAAAYPLFARRRARAGAAP